LLVNVVELEHRVPQWFLVRHCLLAENLKTLEFGVDIALGEADLDRRSPLLRLDTLSVDAFEPLGALQLLEAADALLRVFIKQLPEEALQRRGEAARYFERVVRNVVENLLEIRIIVGRQTDDELKQEGPHRVEVDRVVVAVADQQLRRTVLGRAAEGVGEAALGHPQFREAEVHESDVPVEVEDDVLGLQVPI